MPVIKFTSAATLCEEQQEALRRQFTSIVCKVPAKKSKSCMTFFSTGLPGFFNDMPSKTATYITIDTYGPVDIEFKKIIVPMICEAVEKVTDIEKQDIYISFSEFQNFGVNGLLF